MSSLRSEAYVLVRHPLTESSWIVSLFTREEGRVRAVAKGAKRTKSPFRGALEPLSRVRVEVSLREGRDLGTVISADLEEGAMDLYGRWPQAAVLMAVMEVLERGLPEHSREEDTFRLVGAVLEGLRAGASCPCSWAYFAVWFLRLHGILPRPDRCVTCGGPPRPLRFDAGAAGWVCPKCQVGRPGRGVDLDRGGEAALGALLASPLRELAGEAIAPESLRNLLDMVYLALVTYLGRPLESGAGLENNLWR